MDASVLTVYALPFLLSLISVALIRSLLLPGAKGRNGKALNLPPSPPGLPYFNNMLYVRRMPLHRNFTELSKKYGGLFLLHIGPRPLLIISSASAAEKCLVNHDTIFANRPVSTTVGKIFGFNYSSIGFVPYGPDWRNVRRAIAMEILSTTRLNQLSYIRSEEVRVLAKELAAAASTVYTWVEPRRKLATMSFHILMRMLMGVRVDGSDPEAQNFINNFAETTVITGTIFPGDFIPLMKLLDFGRFEGRMRKVRDEGNRFLRRIIEERRKVVSIPSKEELDRGDQEREIKCLIDSIIAQQKLNPDYYTDDIVYGALSFLQTAGTDAPAVTVEWALALLINHPDVLQKLRDEVEARVEKGALVGDQDLPHLPYLQAVISETLRLYPALPLLFPHATSQDCVIDGYDIPAGTFVFVNAPAIHRDENMWEEAEKFKPERFLNNKELTSKSGGGSKYIPFGTGRRRCPGEGLSLRIVGLTLATLVQCFDWKSVDGKEIDMEDYSSLTMLKKVPLQAVYKVRDSMLPALA